MIVKVQLSLSDAQSWVLVYDRAEEICVQFPATPDIVALCQADERFGGLKTYCRAEIVDTKLVLGDRVDDADF